MNPTVYQLLFILLPILLVEGEIEDGVSYLVGAGKVDCFYREFKKGDKMDFDMQVSF